MHPFVLAVALLAAQAGPQVESQEFAAKFVAARHYELGNEEFATGKYVEAEHEFGLSLISFPTALASEGRAHARFKLGNYSGVVEDLSNYLAENPDDSSALALRGVAKSLLKPEDVAGACEDFLKALDQLQKLGTDAQRYCNGEPGWETPAVGSQPNG